MKTVLQISPIDRDLNKYPDIFINEIEEAIMLVNNDYAELGKIRQRVAGLLWMIDAQMGDIKYGHLPKYEPVLDDVQVGYNI